MKRLFIFLLSLSLIFPAFSQHRPKTVHVKTYSTKKGKLVHSHYRARPSHHK